MSGTTARPAPRPPSPLLLAAFAALAAWLLLPLLTPAHVEGFSASIVSFGLHAAGGDVASYDRLFPVNLEFFGLSRSGAWLAVGLVHKLLGVSGDAAMRLVMWGGTAALALASGALVRRWTGAPLAGVAAALLVLPGAAETTFFFADNVLASALAVGALALVAAAGRRGVAPLVAAGVLLGLGVLTRADAVLLSPAVPLLLVDPERARARGLAGAVDRGLVWRTAVVAAVTVATMSAVLAAYHSTYLDVLAISSYIVRVWGRGLAWKKLVLESALFVGVPGAVLVAAGGWHVLRSRPPVERLLLVGMPVLYVALCFGKILQARQLLHLTPFLAALVVWGWRALGAGVAGVPGRAARLAVAALVAVTLAAPPVALRYDDGPRVLAGRLWTPVLWRRWQRAVDGNLADVDAFVAGLGPGTTAVVTDQWDGDRYLHLALQEHGYRVDREAPAEPSCARTAEVFRRGDRAVVHVRLHDPHFPTGPVLVPQRFAAYGAPCLQAAGAAGRTYYMAPIDWLGKILGPAVPATPWVARERAGAHVIPPIRQYGFQPQVAVPVGPAELARMGAGYAAKRDEFLRLPGARALPAPYELSDAEVRMAARNGFPDGRPAAAARGPAVP